jgi:hypothetical protein
MVTSSAIEKKVIEDNKPEASMEVKLKIQVLERETGISNDLIKRDLEKLLEERDS